MADGKELNENLESANQNASQLANNLKDIAEKAVGAEATFRDIAGAMKDLAKNSPDVANAIKGAVRNQQALARNVARLAKFTEEDIKDKKLANSIEKQSAEQARLRQRAEADLNYLQKLRLNATEEEEEILDKVIEKLQDGGASADEIAKFFDQIVGANDELNRKTNFFDKLSSSLGMIPGLGPVLSGPFSKAARDLRRANVEGATLAEKAKIIGKSFQDIALAGLVASLFKADSTTTDLAKQLGVSKEEARGIRSQFNEIAVDSGVAALNSISLAESMIQLGDTMGATAGFTNQQVVDQTKLTQMVGLQAEQAAKLAEFGTLNGEETRSVTTDILEQVALLEKETGIRLEGRKILAEVANISGQLGAQYGYNTQQLAKAVVQAQRLGLSLEDTQGIAGNLLDFEQSITNELNAELLLGRNLNLEQARLLALQGKSSEAAAELAKQFGSAEEFSSLNVIQQQSLADAMGMSVDQLADSIKKQEVLNALGEKNFDTLMETEEGRERIKNLGGEQLLQQLEQQSAADKFQQAVVKIQAAIGSIVEGPLGNLVDKFADLANNSFVVYTTLGLMAALSLTKVIGSIVSLGLTLVKAAASAGALKAFLNPVGFAVGLAAIAGLGFAISRAIEPVDDMVMPAGYGDRILSTPKGTVALNNQDTIVAGTNLGQGSSNQETNPSNQETKRTNMLLEKLIIQNDKKPQLSPVGLYEVQ